MEWCVVERLGGRRGLGVKENSRAVQMQASCFFVYSDPHHNKATIGYQ